MNNFFENLKFFQIKKERMFFKCKFFTKQFRIPTSIGLTRLKINNDILSNQIHFINRHGIFGNIFMYLLSNSMVNKEYELKKIEKWYIEHNFYLKLGYFPDLENPTSFNEKINYLKLHYRNPVQGICHDKYEFKKYIKDKLGDGFTAKILAVYNNVQEINFNKLPNQFVIKNTFGGYGVESSLIIVKDKHKENLDRIKFIMNDAIQNWWKDSYYDGSHITNGKARIIAEEYLDQGDGHLYDYKFFCFHGEVKFLYIATHGDAGTEYLTYFDLKWNKMPIVYDSYKNIPYIIERPECFYKMIEIATYLSNEFPFVRIDMYVVKNKIYIGEMTFTPGSGFGKYSPRKFDYKFGKFLDLDKIKATPYYCE